MNLIDAFAKLKQLDQYVIKTADVATLFEINLPHASKVLARLAQGGLLIHISRGKWVFSNVDRMLLPQILVAPFPAYISLLSGLYFHGMISQIPQITYAVSLARTKEFKTALGGISIHHVDPDFFYGFTQEGDVNIASPEKALIDTLYLATVKNSYFKKLPEIELSKAFDKKNALNLIATIKAPKKRSNVLARFNHLSKVSIYSRML